jgi:hypothetical protein
VRYSIAPGETLGVGQAQYVVALKAVNPGFRCAAPWAIESDPFGVEINGEKLGEKSIAIFKAGGGQYRKTTHGIERN